MVFNVLFNEDGILKSKFIDAISYTNAFNLFINKYGKKMILSIRKVK